MNGVKLRVEVVEFDLTFFGGHVEVAVGDARYTVHWDQPVNLGNPKVVTFDIGNVKASHHQELDHGAERCGREMGVREEFPPRVENVLEELRQMIRIWHRKDASSSRLEDAIAFQKVLSWIHQVLDELTGYDGIHRVGFERQSERIGFDHSRIVRRALGSMEVHADDLSATQKEIGLIGVPNVENHPISCMFGKQLLTVFLKFLEAFVVHAAAGPKYPWAARQEAACFAADAC